jgi:anti-anti-sigma factor
LPAAAGSVRLVWVVGDSHVANAPGPIRRLEDNSMKLSMVSIDKDGIVRIRADGSITSADLLADAKNPLEALVGTNWSNTRLMLDLSKVHYIDSSAIGWLINSHKELKDHGGRIVAHSIQPAVMQVLKLLKIEQVVAMADNEAAARSVLTGAAQ